MIDLIEASFRGLEFHSPYYDDWPLDFAYSTGGMTLVMGAGWWGADWGPSDGLEFFHEPLVAEIVHAGEEPTRWSVQDVEGVEVTFAADADMAARIARAREGTDLYRGEYRRELDKLQASLGDEFDLSPWIDAVAARPVLDAVKEFRKTSYDLRKIGSLFSRDANDRRDVLVIDEFGNAAVGVNSPWLKVFADQWTEREDRPEMEEFLAWAQEQRTPTGETFESVKIEMAVGTVDEIAQRYSAPKP